MKTLWSVITILAVAHMLGFLGVVGFLGASDRLNRQRVDAVRAVFTRTITEQTTEQQAEQARTDKEHADALRQANLDQANPGVELRNEFFRTVEQSNAEIIGRGRRDLESMMTILDQRLSEVEARENALTQRETQFEERFGTTRDKAAVQQFQQMITLLNGLKPADLKSKLDVYLTNGDVDLVVNIIKTLPTRNASKVLALYQSDIENRVAADLLLRLKNQDLQTTSEMIADANSTASAAQTDQ